MAEEQQIIEMMDASDPAFDLLQEHERAKLRLAYPGMSDKGIETTLQIRQQKRDYLSERNFQSWDQAEAAEGDLMNEGYFTVADNRINEEGQAMLYLFKDLEGMYSPETADTLQYYVDPEMFKDIKIGDTIKGLSMFNVMQYGYKLEQ